MDNPQETLTRWRLEAISVSEPQKSIDGISAQAGNWPDEASRRAETRLAAKNIHVPWHYGDHFGDRFRVVGLRAGGSGAVFFVENAQFEKRRYAAKTLRRFLHQDYLALPSYTQKAIADAFLEEALPWLEMGQHSSIVTVHLLENIIHPHTKRNIPFVFSEFIEGGDLRQFVRKRGKLSLAETVSMGLQICHGLLHAYKHGLSAHKDLKPDNIMVYKEGVYKVSDFSAGVIGTDGYMSPEQVAVHRKIQKMALDPRSDQFAIGLILYDIVKGGDTQDEQRKRIAYIQQDIQRFLRKGIEEIIAEELLPGLKDIITRCLRPKAEERFASIAVLKEKLLQTYRGEFNIDYQFPEIARDDSVEWWFNRGMAFDHIGRSAFAEIPYKEALKRLVVIPGEEKNYASCLMNLGTVYGETCRYEQAEAHHKDALQRYAAILGTEVQQVRCLVNLGIVYSATGRYEQAEAHYKDALQRCAAIPGAEIEQVGCFVNLGNVYVKTGRYEQAEAHYKDVLKRCSAFPGTERDEGACLGGMGIVYSATGRYGRAGIYLLDALEIYAVIPGTDIAQAKCLMLLGNVFIAIGSYEQAEAYFQDALKRYAAIPGTDIDQAGCLENMAWLYKEKKMLSRSRQCALDALKHCEAIEPEATLLIRSKCQHILKEIEEEEKTV